MKLLAQELDNFTLALHADEIKIIARCAAHVLYSFAMGDHYDLEQSTNFDTKRGKIFADSMRVVQDNLNAEYATIDFSLEELLYLTKIIGDAVKYIGTEFQTLTAYTPSEAIQVQQSIIGLLYPQRRL